MRAIIVLSASLLLAVPALAAAPRLGVEVAAPEHKVLGGPDAFEQRRVLDRLPLFWRHILG